LVDDVLCDMSHEFDGLYARVGRLWVANYQSLCKYPEGSRLADSSQIVIRIRLHSEHGAHDGVRAVDMARGSEGGRAHLSTAHHAAIGV
jgi:hypothetical protein